MTVFGNRRKMVLCSAIKKSHKEVRFLLHELSKQKVAGTREYLTKSGVRRGWLG